MSVQRHSYAYSRVLIDSARVLSAQFDDAVIYVTGAQLELLRNVTQYLNRITTYASEIQPGYYTTPDANDFDDILEIVADLEETLMGNPNTIWGYSDVYGESFFNPAMPAGTSSEYGSTVPSGEVWRVTGVALKVDSATCTRIVLLAYIDGAYLQVADILNPVDGQLYTFLLDVVLAVGGFMYVSVYGMTLSDNLSHTYRGYKMVVPE